MRRLSLAVAALLIVGLRGGSTPMDDEGAICPTPSAASRIKTPIDEATLLALERENGCLEDVGLYAAGQGAGTSADTSWPPGWKSAHMSGGDVAPVRVVSDPYPTLHSVVVDAERNRVFFSDPNRHALWSYDRLGA